MTIVVVRHQVPYYRPIQKQSNVIASISKTVGQDWLFLLHIWSWYTTLHRPFYFYFFFLCSPFSPHSRIRVVDLLLTYPVVVYPRWIAPIVSHSLATLSNNQNPSLPFLSRLPTELPLFNVNWLGRLTLRLVSQPNRAVAPLVSPNSIIEIVTVCWIWPLATEYRPTIGTYLLGTTYQTPTHPIRS